MFYFMLVVVHSTSGRQAEVCEDKAHKVDGGNSVIRRGLVCSSEKRVMAEKLGHDSVDSSQKSVKKEVCALIKGFLWHLCSNMNF